ncbi:MAG: polyprenyl synthetase family protein [Bacteroidaceae bacterium]|nr:polyprenyl synthetase family protein [Bacteroidaceae bacterium]
MNNTLDIIRKPIEKEFAEYLSLFNTTLSHSDELQNTIFEQIKSRGGKRLRPTLTLLIAKAVGEVSSETLHSAVALELLHTASLVHDDVVDNSDERRGQASVNSTNGNKLAVLLGDYILSTALLSAASTGKAELVAVLSKVGQTLSDGEILQLKKDSNLDLNYETYYKIIEQKTASLFMACCEMGVFSATVPGAFPTDSKSAAAIEFGRLIGLIFQIRDDIFDYLPTKELGKPAAKDMREGKITLPALYVLNQLEAENKANSAVPHETNLMDIARKVKLGTITDNEISYFINYTLEHGGIQFAEQKMQEFAEKAHALVEDLTEKPDLREALHTLVNFFSKRSL